MHRYIFCAIFLAEGMKTQIPESSHSLKNPPTQVAWVRKLDFLRAPWPAATTSGVRPVSAFFAALLRGVEKAFVRKLTRHGLW